jgi:hypothetical protein
LIVGNAGDSAGDHFVALLAGWWKGVRWILATTWRLRYELEAQSFYKSYIREQ